MVSLQLLVSVSPQGQVYLVAEIDLFEKLSLCLTDIIRIVNIHTKKNTRKITLRWVFFNIKPIVSECKRT